MYVPCQKLNCSKCKLSFFPSLSNLSLVPQRVREEEAGTGRGVIECLLSYCITTELYDPALTLECMQPYNSCMNRIISCFSLHTAFQVFYLATGILQYVLGLKNVFLFRGWMCILRCIQ